MTTNLKLYISNTTENEYPMIVLREFGAIVNKTSSESEIILPKETQVIAHDEDTTVIGQTSLTTQIATCQIPDGPMFDCISKTVGEYGTYHTTHKLSIHLNTI